MACYSSSWRRCYRDTRGDLVSPSYAERDVLAGLDIQCKEVHGVRRELANACLAAGVLARGKKKKN